MTHDVFISYSSSDKTVADALCARLEGQAIRCWIAPRDVPPGRPYAAELVTAIRGSRVMVLVFSKSANLSPYVTNEVDRAVAHGVSVLPVRIEDVLPTSDMEFYLSRPHWLDAITPPLEAHLDRIVDATRALLREPEVAAKATPAALAAGAPARAPREAAPEGSAEAAPPTLATYQARVREECERIFASNLVRPDRVYVPQYAASLADGTSVDLGAVATAFWSGRTRRVAVIGNYGMGKTYFTWRAQLDQLDRMDREREQTLPILFPLKRFNYAESVESAGRGRDLVAQVLDYATGLDFPRVDRKHFIRWIEDGIVAVILDGLDELTLPRRVTWQDAIAPITGIGGARVLLTSRTAYLRDPSRELAGFDSYELAAWGEREWRQYLDSSAEKLAAVGGTAAFAEVVASRPSLASLTTRPLWCFMMVEIADRIVQTQDLQVSGLYQQFLDRAVSRRLMMDSMLTLAWQYCAMERFAEACVERNDATLDEPALLTLMSQLFESVGHQQLQQFLTDQVRQFAFLNCDRQRRYTFGHQSFEDYFAAAGVARWMAGEATGEPSGPPERVARQTLVASRRLSDEQVQFAAGILRDEAAVRSLELGGSSAAELRGRILRFMERTLRRDGGNPVLRGNLFRVFIDVLRADEAPRPPVLEDLCLRETNLAGLDLRDCAFEAVDFTDAVLSRACFAGSRFTSCTFFGAAVDGADFSGADLAGADLTGIDPGDEPPILAGAKGLERATLGTRERRLLRL